MTCKLLRLKHNSELRFLHWLMPVTSKRNLLFIAALIWTFAGIMLLTRGTLMLGIDQDLYLLPIAVSFLGGILFYFILFSRIATRYINRIIDMTIDRPNIFSFFSLKGYLMMAGMISMGTLLRKSEAVSPFYLSILYLTMGVPLFISSLRFYYSAIHYAPTQKKNCMIKGFKISFFRYSK